MQGGRQPFSWWSLRNPPNHNHEAHRPLTFTLSSAALPFPSAPLPHSSSWSFFQRSLFRGTPHLGSVFLTPLFHSASTLPLAPSQSVCSLFLLRLALYCPLISDCTYVPTHTHTKLTQIQRTHTNTQKINSQTHTYTRAPHAHTTIDVYTIKEESLHVNRPKSSIPARLQCWMEGGIESKRVVLTSAAYPPSPCHLCLRCQAFPLIGSKCQPISLVLLLSIFPSGTNLLSLYLAVSFLSLSSLSCLSL